MYEDEEKERVSLFVLLIFFCYNITLPEHSQGDKLESFSHPLVRLRFFAFISSFENLI